MALPVEWLDAEESILVATIQNWLPPSKKIPHGMSIMRQLTT